MSGLALMAKVYAALWNQNRYDEVNLAENLCHINEINASTMHKE